jgi:hypothetical protein
VKGIEKEGRMSTARWSRCVAMAVMACAASAALAQRGPAAGMGGGWGGGHWHGGGWHHDDHWHGGYGASVGIYIGPGAYWGWPYGYDAWPYDDPWPYYDAYGYPYAYAYPAPHVTYAVPTDRPYTVERAPSAAPDPPSFRYYCGEPKGYYPQVTNCTQPWLRVLPDDAQAPGDASGAPGAPPSGK